MTRGARTDAPGATAKRIAGIGATFLLAAVAPAWAADGGRWFSVGVLAGSLQPDRELADYQWDSSPSASWGGQLLAGAGPWAAGARVVSAQHEHRLGLPNVAAPRVRGLRCEAVGRRRLAAAWGTEVAATASAGVMRLSWRPDHLDVESGGGGSPIAVDLRPIVEWTAAAGVALRRPIAPAWAAGIEIDHHVYRLDTERREGGPTVARRETFGDWSARVELAWLRRASRKGER